MGLNKQYAQPSMEIRHGKTGRVQVTPNLTRPELAIPEPDRNKIWVYLNPTQIKFRLYGNDPNQPQF